MRLLEFFSHRMHRSSIGSKVLCKITPCMKMWSCCCDDISSWAAVAIQLLQREPHVRPPLCSRHPLTRWLLSIAVLQTSACGCGVHFSHRPFPANIILIIFNKVWTVRLREEGWAVSSSQSSGGFEFWFQAMFCAPIAGFLTACAQHKRGQHTRSTCSRCRLCGMCARLILTQSTKVTVVRIMIRFGFTREANTSSSGESYASVCACDPHHSTLAPHSVYASKNTLLFSAVGLVFTLHIASFLKKLSIFRSNLEVIRRKYAHSYS